MSGMRLDTRPDTHYLLPSEADDGLMGVFRGGAEQPEPEPQVYIPLYNWLFTPVLQWQSRGKMVYLTGVSEYKHGTPSMLAVYPCVTVAIQG